MAFTIMGYLQNLRESSRLVFDECFSSLFVTACKGYLGCMRGRGGWMGEWVGDFSERNRGVQQIERVSERRHREYVLWNDQAHFPLSWVMCQTKPITTSLAMHPTLRSGVGDYVNFPSHYMT